MTADMPGLSNSEPEDNELKETPATDAEQDQEVTNTTQNDPHQDDHDDVVNEIANTQVRTDTIASSEVPPESDEISADEPAAEPVEGHPQAEPAEAVAEQTQEHDDDDDDVSATDPDDDDDDDDAEDAEQDGNAGEPAKKRRVSGYERGEIIDVAVMEVSPTSVVVSLDERGEGFTGLIPARELDRMSGDMMEMLQPGELVKLYVVNPGDPKGNVVLSLNRALEELDWQNAEEYRESRQTFDGFVGGYNKGGLIVRFGRLRGFIPQSQISDERRARVTGDTPEERYSGMIREPITVKVIEVDRGRNRLILSERAAMRETREQRKAKLIEELALNEVRTGHVVSLEDFGAFVDIGGAEGLVHVTELSWGHVTHPKQVLEVGQEITVEVISIDPKRKRIGLSLKRQLPDPWDIVASNYQQGQLVKATVTKLTKFGAFAQLTKQPEVEGLIHISELSENRVAHPREVVDIGEELTLRIVKIDVADRRLGLSLKAVNSTEYLDSDMDFLFDE